MERRNFIKAAGTAIVASPWLGGLALAKPFPSTNQTQEADVAAEAQSIQPGTSPGPVPYPNVEIHPGWVRSGVDDTPGMKAYYIHLEAKPGRGDDVQRFLRDILAGVAGLLPR